jgi:urease accessory protein
LSWHGQLELNYRMSHGETVADARHQGPLRVLKSLYPEGSGICHQVLLHPPAGLVGGDELDIRLQLGAQTHVVLTTPGATRFYRSEGPTATQRVAISLQAGARCEWLPMENIAYNGCQAHNQFTLQLQGNAQAMGWDILALGLPAAAAPFQQGCFEQRLQIEGIWLERGRIDAQDRVLMESPLGLAGRPVIGTAWWASGEPLPEAERAHMLEVARDALEPVQGNGLAVGITSPQPRCLVARCVAPHVEFAAKALKAVRSAWRQTAWGLSGDALRIWAT